MNDIETKVRPLSGITVSYHGQLKERVFEQPIPPGTIGIRLLDHGEPYVDILNQEIAIYTRGYSGDEVSRRLVATLSVDDAKLLAEKLNLIINKVGELKGNFLPKTTERTYNPDYYPPALIIREPDVEIGGIASADIESPYPAGSEEKEYAIFVTSLSPDGQRRLPALLLDVNDANTLMQSINHILKTTPTRGKGAVAIEQRVNPQRVVRF